MADLSIGTTIGGSVAYHAGNYFPTKADVGLNLVNNWGASDSYTSASSTTYATSKAVKDAYDAAIASAAASVDWTNITGKPTTFAPATHVHTAADISDLNNQNAGAVASTLVLRDASADIVARLLRTNYADEAGFSGAIAYRVNNSSNNYTRYCNSPASVMAWLGAATSGHNHTGSYFSTQNGAVGTDFNAALTEGLYSFTGTNMANSPRSGTIYGRLKVYVSDGTTHNNSNNWIWQEYMDTSGLQYYRFKVNSGAWTAWQTNFNGLQIPTAAQVGALEDNGSATTLTLSNWIRTSGQTGWYSATYGGGVYMIDTTWLRSYQNKGFYTAGEGAFGGNVTAYYSDERLKDIDEELDPDFCLAAVNKWRKVRYHANDLGAQYGYKKDKAEIGLLAGEIQEDFPELTPLAPFDFETLEDGTIISKSGENYRTMNYERIVAVQAAAITALTRRLEQLEEKLNG